MTDQLKFNKRILIISNNVLSTQNNNGKTLLSFFKDLPRDKIAQLYFSSEEPNYFLAKNYYCLSDSEIFKNNIFTSLKKKTAGEIPKNKVTNRVTKHLNNKAIKRFEIVRLIRELMWKTARIDQEQLSHWVQNFNPELIFFCAGDSIFAYRLYNSICSLVPSAKKVVYITDDYILPRRKISPFWWLRRSLIFSKMKVAITQSDVFTTISNEMKEKYLTIFGRDSNTIFNIPEDMRITPFKKTPRKDLILIYTGGLHFNRGMTLRNLALAIDQFNKKKQRSVLLKIYSHQKLDAKTISSLEVQGSSIFCGSLDSEGVRLQLNDADILVHVESFNQNCIESTRLSISTKISEYLSVGSKILAIGPKNVASIRFLQGSATCITSNNQMEEKLAYILENDSITNFSDILCKIKKNNKQFYENILK